MIVYPNAKINLGLDVLEKRIDGYHEIASVFYPVKDLFDILEIVPSDDFSFSTSGFDIPGIIDENICVKAFNLLKADFSIQPVKIHLHKKIPIGGGLGGGSADGSFTLIVLNQLFDLQLSDIQLQQYALQLGSDCPFFIDNTPKYVTGRGECLQSLDLDLSSFEVRFIFSDLHIPTADSYTRVVCKTPRTNLLSLIKQPIESWKGRVKNDFEYSTFIDYPKLKDIKEKLYADGAIYASMSGTGSVFYGLFNR
tara:strand:- start:261 stop:1016 length:756 start_codon:yes stop_codon:yes gene_type:complete